MPGASSDTSSDCCHGLVSIDMIREEGEGGQANHKCLVLRYISGEVRIEIHGASFPLKKQNGPTSQTSNK